MFTINKDNFFKEKRLYEKGFHTKKIQGENLPGDAVLSVSSSDFPGGRISLLWQPDRAGTGIRLLRVFGDSPALFLPDGIDGKKITEIGAYCFAPSRPKFQGEIFPSSSEKGQPLTELCGSFLEEVRLPAFVTTLHNAAFYNCRKLKKLSVGTEISGIGSDEFTNDTRLARLIVRGQDTVPTGLPLILERIAENLTVCFCPEKDALVSVLFFPEYYEWLDEISPAHIFSRSINGEGFRMRKSFQNGVLDYDKYDACFENALALESPETLCQIALNRLRYPAHLKTAPRQKYEKTVQEFLPSALQLSIKAQDFALLTFLGGSFSPDTAQLSEAIEKCIDADWGEGSAYLIEKKHHRFTKKTFDFDLDF